MHVFLRNSDFLTVLSKNVGSESMKKSTDSDTQSQKIADQENDQDPEHRPTHTAQNMNQIKIRTS
jgi:hypothetical protein